MLNYLFLLLAIVAEAAGTTLLKMSDQFTKLVPSISSLVCYVASLYLLSLCLRTIPIGIAYATWSALGIALITISGIYFFKQMPDIGAIIGLVLIISGVAVLNLFSKMDIHEITSRPPLPYGQSHSLGHAPHSCPCPGGRG